MSNDLAIPAPTPETSSHEPDEYNLYLGFLIPIGAILLLCIISLFVVSWQIICPECSNRHCPKILLSGSHHIANMDIQQPETPAPTNTRGYNPLNRRTSITLLRRYSDAPPSYETVEVHPPSYDSVVIIEEESPNMRRSRDSTNTRTSSIRTYVYDPTRRISIEVHDEDTIRVVEELLARKMTSSRRSSVRNSLSDQRRSLTSDPRRSLTSDPRRSLTSDLRRSLSSDPRRSSFRNSLSDPPGYHSVRFANKKEFPQKVVRSKKEFPQNATRSKKEFPQSATSSRNRDGASTSAS